jgi:hypothetical protein
MFKLNFFDKKELESHMCMICLELKKSDIVSCSKCKSGYVCNNCIKQNYLINKKQLLKCQQCGTWSYKLIYYDPYVNKILIIFIKILYSLYLSLNIINIINSKENFLIIGLSILKIYIILHIVNFLIVNLHNLKYKKFKWNNKMIIDNVNYYSTVVLINYYLSLYNYENKFINNLKSILINIFTIFFSYYFKYIKTKNQIDQLNSAVLSRRI